MTSLEPITYHDNCSLREEIPIPSPSPQRVTKAIKHQSLLKQKRERLERRILFDQNQVRTLFSWFYSTVLLRPKYKSAFAIPTEEVQSIVVYAGEEL
jgi:hypothetical protein